MFKMLFEHIFVLAAFLVGAVEDLLLYHPVILFFFVRFFAMPVCLCVKMHIIIDNKKNH